MSKMDRRILREVIRRRLLDAIDPCQLAALQLDLGLAVERALEQAGRPPDEARDIVAEFLRQAWTSVGEAVATRG